MGNTGDLDHMVTWYRNNHHKTVEFFVLCVLLILAVQTFDEVINEMGPIHQ